MVSHFAQVARVLSADDRPRQRVLDEMGMDDDKIYEIVANSEISNAMLAEIKKMFKITKDSAQFDKRRLAKKACGKDGDRG